jgi:DNA-binding transcriptional LysR family regulator
MRDLVDVPFILFPRRESPAFYDRLMNECCRGLKSRRVVQEARNEATILSLVSHGVGVGVTNETARWRCPESVVILSVADLKMLLPMALVWRKDNLSTLLAQFVVDVRSWPEVQGLVKRGPGFFCVR